MCIKVSVHKEVAVRSSAKANAVTADPPVRLISRDELKEHNTPNDAWASVHSRVINISDFATRHPGGDVILLAAGKDATILFETYHPRGVHDSLLDKIQVGRMEDGAIPVSFYSWDSEFYRTMKKRVVKRLEKRNLNRRGGYPIMFKALILIVGFWFSLYKMCVSDYRAATYWSLAMGIFAAFIGTCIQHDGNHGAFSKNKWINKLAGWTLDMIGASAFTWEVQHMLGHHPYTNVIDAEEEERKASGLDYPIKDKNQESDPDAFSSFPAIRMHPHHKAKWYHRFQHIYAPMLFAFMTLAKVLQQDFEVALSHRLYHIDAECRYGSTFNVIRFWSMKALSATYMICLPCYFHGGLSGGISLFLIGHFACGKLLATMFIVNHVIEGVSFGKKDMSSGLLESFETFGPTTPTPIEKTLIDAQKKANRKVKEVPFNDWAAFQCQTSINWSPGSWFWNHFSGGLCHQIEHHLFPSICHTNYVHIQDVVEATCIEYGVPYQSEPSLFHAYCKMLKHLKCVGET